MKRRRAAFASGPPRRRFRRPAASGLKRTPRPSCSARCRPVRPPCACSEARRCGSVRAWRPRHGTRSFAGSERREPGSTPRRVTRHAAVWLALTAAGPRSGCVRFAPSLGYALAPHQTLPRAERPERLRDAHGPHRRRRGRGGGLRPRGWDGRGHWRPGGAREPGGPGRRSKSAKLSRPSLRLTARVALCPPVAGEDEGSTWRGGME